ncbi:MAG: DUF2029 domain-containing protein [Candidatus Dormibacteraeota bacterium]|nr:DUF2029 domain-containing protein [Candidatus Dormibacteraeota bacterium]
MDRSLSRPVAILLVSLAVLAMAQYFREWGAIPGPLSRTGDYAATYAASTLLRTGHGSQMYDEPVEQAVLAATGTPTGHLNIPFENPPAAAVIAVPFSWLDSALAYRLWDLLQLLLVALAAVVAVRAAPWPRATPRLLKLSCAAVAVAGIGTSLLFFEGQWDGVAALGLALGYAGWRADRRLAAGFAVGLTAAIAKPHLIFGVLAFMFGRRDWRGLAGAAAGIGAAVALSLVAGPGALGAFAGALLKPSNSPGLVMQSAVGMMESWLGAGGWTFLAGVVLSAAALAGAALTGRASRHGLPLEPALLLATTLSLFAAPHLLGHDLTLLTAPLVGALAWAWRRDTQRWPGPRTIALIGGWLAVSLGTMQDTAHAMPPIPGRLTPFALLLMAALAFGVTRSGPPHPAHPASLRLRA